jgi:hypothetical protein
MNEILPLLVSLIGLAVAGIGLLGVVAPAMLVGLLDSHRLLIGLPMTLVVRIVAGSIFVIAAPDCRAPILVRTIGILEFGGAAALIGLGSGRLGRFVEWWLQRPPSFVRFWCLGALALGVVLLCAGA